MIRFIKKIVICRFWGHTWVTNQFGIIRVCNRCHKRESSSFSKEEGSWALKWDNDPIKSDYWSSK